MKRGTGRQSLQDRRGSASAFGRGNVTGGGKPFRGAVGTFIQQLTKGRRNKPSDYGSSSMR